MNQENITVRDLTARLPATSETPLKFYFESAPINPGYHVTEVRYAAINSLDCGNGNEQWDEVTIQLLDGSSGSTEGYMATSKFVGIVSGALKSLSNDVPQHLFFEFAPDNGAIRKLTVQKIENSADEIAVYLGREKALCKPLQRMKAAHESSSDEGRNSSKKACC